MTKADLVNELALSTGYDKKTIVIIVEGMMESIKNHMANGEDVFLRGFGTYTKKKRAAKVAQNINRQTTIRVPAHNVVHFKPSKDFAALVR